MLELSLREVREQTLSRVERAYLVAQLEASQGRIGVAAQRCGLDPRSLYEKMRRHGLKKEDYRPQGRRKRTI